MHMDSVVRWHGGRAGFEDIFSCRNFRDKAAGKDEYLEKRVKTAPGILLLSVQLPSILLKCIEPVVHCSRAMVRYIGCTEGLPLQP